MGETTMEELGMRIREARARRGVSQEELGSAAGLERSAVSKIEAGGRKVSALELSDIAAALGTRMSEFFEDPSPAVVFHRSSQGLDTVDSRIDTLLAKLARDVEFVAEFTPNVLTQGRQSMTVALTEEELSTQRGVESVALQTRRLLSVSPDEPLVHLGERVAQAGLLAFAFDIGADTADAGSLTYSLGGIAIVNSHMKVGRRRLALAHELGHHLMRDSYVVDWRINQSHGDSLPLESRLDRFARALLLPDTAIRAEWTQLSESAGSSGAAIVLASRFRVDFSTLSTRLRELDLVDSDTSALIRRCAPTPVDYIELDIHAPPEELIGTSVPRAFSKAVFDLVRKERISRERALDLLQGTFEESNLPSIRMRRPDEIWTFVS